MAPKKNIRDGEQKMRHIVSVPKVYELVHDTLQRKADRFSIFKELRAAGFGGIMLICKWTKILTFFIDFVTKNFDSKNMSIKLYDSNVFPLTLDDVHRVYELPKAGKKINLNLCFIEEIIKIREELRLKGSFSQTVKVIELEEAIRELDDAKACVKGAILLIIHNLFCPTHKGLVSLCYAHILKNIADIASFNWCSHILDYMREGLKNPEASIPLADFHFLMINYMEKMGKDSPFLTGKYKRPALREWDVKAATDKLKLMYTLMGLERALVAGVTTVKKTEEKNSSPVFWFDPEKCVLHSVEDSIKIMTSDIETLKRILAGRCTPQNLETTIKKDDTCKSIIKYRRKNHAERVPDTIKEKPINQEMTPTDIPRFRLFEDDEYEILNKEIDDVVDKTVSSTLLLTCSQQIIIKEVDDIIEKATNSQKELICTQETVNKEVDDTVDDETNSAKELTCTEETIRRFPQYFGEKIVPSQKLGGDAETTNVEDYKLQKKKRKTEKENLQDNHEGKRVAKKSKYLKSPYKEDVEKSNTTQKQKNIATYAWSEELSVVEPMYINGNYFAANLVREDTLTLRDGEWVSNVVIDAWVNCFYTKQPKTKITRLITPCLLYTDVEKHKNDKRKLSEAAKDFSKRLNNFNIHWKNIDFTNLEYIMAPAIVGNTGCHFVCYAVNLKTHKFEFLNSLSSMKLHDVDGDPTYYMRTFDLFLKEALSYLQSMSFRDEHKRSHSYEMYKIEIPEMPQQPDKNSCGVFCMKFLEEWQGDPSTMKSFKGWNEIPKSRKEGQITQEKKVMDWRIQLCSSIITDKSNTIKTKVERKTLTYIKSLKEKLNM